MLLTKFDPIKDFRDLEERLTTALKFPDTTELSNVSGFSPSVNTREGEYAYHVEVDLPGVKKDDIHVDLKDDVLTISGESKRKITIRWRALTVNFKEVLHFLKIQMLKISKQIRKMVYLR
jgi:HSP20 family protein